MLILLKLVMHIHTAMLESCDPEDFHAPLSLSGLCSVCCTDNRQSSSRECTPGQLSVFGYPISVVSFDHGILEILIHVHLI